MNNLDYFQDFINQSEWALPLLLLLAVWSLFWKGAALWHAARKKDRLWFFIILIVNTVGVLEIVYLLFVRRQQAKNLYK